MAPQPEIPRNELLLKLFFGEQLPAQVLIGYVERMAKAEREVLDVIKGTYAEIARNQQYPGVPYWKMVARFGELELEAHLRWAQETIAELKKLARKRRSHAETRKEKKHASQ